VSDYLITVAFEIVTPKTKFLIGSSGLTRRRTKPGPGIVTRLLGRRIENAPAFKDEYEHPNPVLFNKHLVSLKVVRIHGANSVVALTFDLPAKNIESAKDLRRVNSTRVQRICSEAGFELVSGHYVYGVTASTSSPKLGLESHVQDAWMHFAAASENLFLHRQLAEALATRIAIERSLIAEALDDPQNSFIRWTRTPFAARSVRNWPVELLIDKQSTQQAFKLTRDAMNLANLREEVLDRARTWYLGVGTILAFVGAIVALVALFRT
jgi:hypothetical protein